MAFGAVILAGAWGGFLGNWHLQGRASILDRIEASTADWRLLIAGERAPPDGIVIVAIDDETVRRAGAYPIPRDLLAQLVNRLTDSGAKAIALDMLFLDRGAAEADARLADAIRRARAVIGAVALFSRGEAFSDTSLAKELSVALPIAERIVTPVSPMADAGEIGVVNISADHGGTPRYVPLLIRFGADLLPCFALRVSALAAGSDPEIEQNDIRIGGAKSALDIGYHLPLRFYGPRGMFPTISAQTILEGGSADAIAGRIVLVGATAIGTADTFATAFDPLFPGVEVEGTAVAHLVTGGGLIRDVATRRIDFAASMILPILTVLALCLRRISIGIAFAFAPLVVWLAIVLFAFTKDYWLAMALPLAATLPTGLLFGSVRLWLEQRSKQRVRLQREAFRRFQSPAIASTIAANPRFLFEPVQQNGGILFVDLSGFTALSEHLGAQRTRDFLKEFHSIIEDEALRYSGYVESFMGDGAMLVFGLPAPCDDDAARAIDAALSLGRALKQWISGLALSDNHALGIRIGVHYGGVVLSRLGAETHQHITATGDVVNVASRLLDVAKQSGAEIVFSDDAVAAAGFANAERLRCFTGARHVAIRGRAQPLAVWFGKADAKEEQLDFPDANVGRRRADTA
ncbi:MAG: adenylate/guanylate cyclase domain-containing protein [Methylobacteriaceae bacterium]|nr:adenylate/guanylate cyclase domain-containing protein [Methylobacteriaceae bacterium]